MLQGVRVPRILWAEGDPRMCIISKEEMLHTWMIWYGP